MRRARDFTGGYGLLYSGRWNTPSRPVTYCATVPSLAALEKRVHVTDPSLLPPLAVVEYDVPDDISSRVIDFRALPVDWVRREVDTQRIGDGWLDEVTEAMLVVPSAIVPLPDIPARNVLINHRHADAARITMSSIDPFSLDPRLFVP